MQQVGFLKNNKTKQKTKQQSLYRPSILNMLGKTQCIVINCCQFFVGLFLNKHSKEVVIGEKEIYLFFYFF